MPMSNKNITFIIGTLGVGGAEQFMARLANKLTQKKWSVQVLSLRGGGMEKRLTKKGIPYKIYNPNSPLSLPVVVKWLIKNSRRSQIVQSWMDIGNLLGAITCYYLDKPLVWSIRRTLPAVQDSVFTKIALYTTKIISGFAPSKIIANSKSGAKSYIDYGFSNQLMETIRNGYNCNHFSPYNGEPKAFKNKYNIPSTSPIIGRAGRYSRMKDYPTFFKSFKKIREKYNTAHAIVCGRNLTRKNSAIMNILNKLKIKEHVTLLGEIDQMQNFYNIADLILSSSKGEEGCPNVIGESMACGTPCIATDVGDSAYLINNEDYIVPPHKPGLLAQQAINFLQLSKSAKVKESKRVRKRCINNFSINVITKKYINTYNELIS